MESSENVLSCTCRIETIDKTGAVLKTQTLTKAELIIGRNQFQDVVLKVSYPEGKQGQPCCLLGRALVTIKIRVDRASYFISLLLLLLACL